MLGISILQIPDICPDISTVDVPNRREPELEFMSDRKQLPLHPCTHQFIPSTMDPQVIP